MGEWGSGRGGGGVEGKDRREEWITTARREEREREVRWPHHSLNDCSIRRDSLADQQLVLQYLFHYFFHLAANNHQRRHGDNVLRSTLIYHQTTHTLLNCLLNARVWFFFAPPLQMWSPGLDDWPRSRDSPPLPCPPTLL